MKFDEFLNFILISDAQHYYSVLPCLANSCYSFFSEYILRELKNDCLFCLVALML